MVIQSMSWTISAIVLELFSWKTASHKDYLEVCQNNSRLLSGLIGMCSSMKIILHENNSNKINF